MMMMLVFRMLLLLLLLILLIQRSSDHGWNAQPARRNTQVTRYFITSRTDIFTESYLGNIPATLLLSASSTYV